jgi:hypothetical protein
MATLIKLPSGLVVNLDNVSMIAEDTSRVYFVGAEDDFITNTDIDRATLRAWLDWQTRDIAVELAGREKDAAEMAAYIAPVDGRETADKHVTRPEWLYDLNYGDNVLWQGQMYEVWRVSVDDGVQLSNLKWVDASELTVLK